MSNRENIIRKVEKEKKMWTKKKEFFFSYLINNFFLIFFLYFFFFLNIFDIFIVYLNKFGKLLISNCGFVFSKNNKIERRKKNVDLGIRN